MASYMSSPHVKSTPYAESRALTRNTGITGYGGRTTVLSDDMTTQGSHNLPVLSTRNDAYMREKAYTPFQEIEIHEQFTERPDISIFCKQCDRHVDLRLLNEHKMYHSALETLKYQPDKRPDSVNMLIKRRRGIIRRMKKECTPEKPLDSSLVQRVNEAYEFLKADIEDTYESYRRMTEQTRTDVSGLALNCTPACCTAIGMCSSGNERWKSAMEDTRVFQDCFGNDPRKSFFALYDGHEGRFAAEIAATELHHALLNGMAKFDPRTKCTCTFNMGEEYNASEHDTHSRATSAYTERGELQEESSHVINQIIASCEDKMAAFEASYTTSTPRSGSAETKSRKKSRDKDPFAEKMEQAFTKAHKYTDFLLSWGRDENSKVRWSGCSTLTCVLQELPVVEEEDGNKENENGKKKRGPPPLKKLGVLHLANAGNVQAVLVRGNVPYKLTRQHTPHNTKERNRVIKQGGNISESDKQMRVNGVLSTTRGLGNHGDPELKKCVTTDPYTTSVPIDQYAQFLILASNGIWEVFTEQQAADLCLQVLPQNRVPLSSHVLSESVLRFNDTPEVEEPEEHEDDQSSIADAVAERRKQKKPRASTARSRVSFADENEARGDIEPADENEKPEVQDGQDVEEGQGDTARKHTKKERKKSKKSGNTLDVEADMRTEIGSHIDDDYESDDFDDDDEGHLGDVDTCTDVTSNRHTSLGDHVPTQEEMQREFARGMAERLVQSALLAGSRDNITVMIVLLPGCGV